jgi:hypothetical protein
MSEIKQVSTDAGIELTSSPEANPVTPAWLGEVVLLGEYWRTTGLLDRLQQQVKVNRGRMGQYEVCDFVLVLLAYAVSGAATLKEFFAQLKSVESVVLSMWQRQQCPVASTLSRFLSAIESPAVEALRTLFEADLLEHGFDRDQSGGLLDRCGERFWVFDVDGTHQVARQRAVTQQAAYPAVRRRSKAAVRPGYLGRKRGEGIRSRSAVSQAHTTEWLGPFGAAGNGTPGPDLDRACEGIQHYLQHHGISGSQAIVRLDGFYGTPQFVNRIQQHQLGYLLRCRDYSLLKQSAIQTRIAQIHAQPWSHPECQAVREVFDVGFVKDELAGYSAPVRLLVVRTPRNPHRKPRVGKCIGEWIYELFITGHPQSGLSGADLLSLYYGRGGFEKVLGDEDAEQSCDHWCSWHPAGQEFWQILNQWVWNWRLWMGHVHHPRSPRQTLWVAAHQTPPVADSEPSPVVSEPAIPGSVSAPLVLSRKTGVPYPPESNFDYAPMQVPPGWARSRGKFSGTDFTIVDERTLLCPAGHPMYRRELRQNRLGDLLILFGINPRTCAQCGLQQQCFAKGSKGTGGRRVTVVRKRLFPPDSEPQFRPTASMPKVEQPPQPTSANQPVIWFDCPATRLRRELHQQLQRQHVMIESVQFTPPPQVQTIPVLTRDQRAHRRLSWSERLARNALPETGIHWRVQLFGISSTVLEWLHSLKPSPVFIL